MGKRKNGKKVGSKIGPCKLLPQTRNELTEIVDELFHKCCSKVNLPNQSNLTPSQEWDEYLLTYKLVEKIQKIEKDITLPTYDREEQIEPFLEWLKANKILLDGVEICVYGDEGYGLNCTRDLLEADLVIKVPKSAIMSEQTAKRSYLGSLIEKDPILQHMGNVSLSMHVLGEYVNPKSFWLPYLRILPFEFSTTLYFKPEEIQLLKGSPMLGEAIKQFRNVARQYSYFYRILQELPEAKSWPIKDYFTFDAYRGNFALRHLLGLTYQPKKIRNRWAVSVVMTRLNRIPSKDSSGELALIPAWDMANHEHGVFSTDHNEETNDINCFAHRSFRASEQFKIYYGQRTNTEFFLHSGFVYEDNPNNILTLKLGVSKSDPLFEDKAAILSASSLSVNGSYSLAPGTHPITPELLAFTRIFCMDKESLEKWKADISKAKNLIHEDCDVGTMIQDKTIQFLNIRVTLLTRAYPTALQEDEESLPKLSGNEALIRKCLIEEKKILRDATLYLATRVK